MSLRFENEKKADGKDSKLIKGICQRLKRGKLVHKNFVGASEDNEGAQVGKQT